MRRTALVRRTPLPRGAGPTRTGWLRSATVPAVPRARSAFRGRDTGPDARTRDLVDQRAGWLCEVCNRVLHDGTRWVEAFSRHHRRPRGMGGSSDPSTNSPANLLLVCGSATSPDGCHHDIESNRARAIVRGHLVPQAQDPAVVPVQITYGRTVLLTHEGTYEEPATNHPEENQ